MIQLPAFSASVKSQRSRNIVKSDSVMKFAASAFILQNKSQDDISDLGKGAKDLMVDVFGGKSNDMLSLLCHIIFTKKVNCILSTSLATRFHSQCVYFQIMVWTGMANKINPTGWGWKQENNQFVSIMTEENAAPHELLKIIHCNSSGECKSPRCSCRHCGLPCTAACGSCQTENCDNPSTTQAVDTDEEDYTQNWTLWNLFYGQRCLCVRW